MDRQMIPSPVVGFGLQDFEGKAVLYNLEKQLVVYLNDTAALIFRLCDSKRSVEEIVSLLVESYPGRSEQIGREVEDAVKWLADYRAIQCG